MENLMIVDPRLITAAKALVASRELTEPYVAVPDFPGMFVCLESEKGVQAMTFFPHNGVTYAIGAKYK